MYVKINKEYSLLHFPLECNLTQKYCPEINVQGAEKFPEFQFQHTSAV